MAYNTLQRNSVYAIYNSTEITIKSKAEVYFGSLCKINLYMLCLYKHIHKSQKNTIIHIFNHDLAQ